MIISKYHQPKDKTFEKLGIDECRMFKCIREIKGNAHFKGSQVTDIGNLTTIGGGANFKELKIINLGKLQTIGGNANFYNSQISNLGYLTFIGRNADFGRSQITSLDCLQTIGRDIHVTANSPIDNKVLAKITKGNINLYY